MLFSICFSNLAYIYLKNEKLYKSLEASLKAISILQSHLQDLKK